MMQIPLVDLRAQYRSIKPDIDTAIARVLEHGRFIGGREVSEFERAFAEYVGAKKAVGVASGTAALHLALLACGVGPGDEVVTVAHTFAAAEAIIQTGARPVFVDIDARTYNIDPNLVDAVITHRTRAIIPVHLYGQPAEMAALGEIARRHELWLIEDAAQAHGAEYRGRRCGTLGDVACFSFYPGKNLGAYGDAGAVTGNDQALLAKVRKLRDHGRRGKYEHNEIGVGERLDALQAAILRAKLPHLDGWVEARRARVGRYNSLLAGYEGVLPCEAPGVKHAYHLYVIRVPNRDALLEHLRVRGIEAIIHYPIPVHLQPAYRARGWDGLRLPVTEQAAAEIVSLPLYAELSEEQIEYIATAVRECL